MSLPNECPICSAQNSLEIHPDDKHKIGEKVAEDNLERLFRDCGNEPEKIIETLEAAKGWNESVYTIYLKIIEEKYPKFYELILKVIK